MKKLIVLVLSLFFSGFINAQKKGNYSFSQYYQTIDSLMEISSDRGIFNGNILVTRNDSLVYQKSFGYTDGSEKTKLTKNSLFNIGSISKEFNAVSIVMLIEQGKLNFDDKLSQFGLGLPSWSKKVTIKHLLNYVSGIPRIDYDNVKNEKDILKDLQSISKLMFKPGEKYNYNNNSVFLQKRIIESITKKTYPEFVLENIIIPLKMSSVVFDPDSNHPNKTKCFDVHKINCDEKSVMKNRLWISVNDLNKWVTALHNNKLISRASLELLLKNQYFKNKESSLGSSYNAFALHLHGGQSWQFEAAFMSELKNDLNIFLMSNNKSKGFEIIQSVHKIMKGKTFSLPVRSIYREIRQKCIDNIDLGIQLYYELKKNSFDLYDFKNPKELNGLGNDLIAEKKLNESIKIFNLAVLEFPNNANLYYGLAKAHYKNKEYKLAFLNAKKSLELNPKNINAKEIIDEISKK